MGADVTDRGDLIPMANEADGLAAGPDALDDGTLGEVAKGGNGLEFRGPG